MNKRVQKGVRASLLAVAIILVGWLGYQLLSPREPAYQNRTLTEWLVQAQSASNGASAPDHPESDPNWLACRNALLQMGDSAFPFLIRELTAKQSKVTPKLATISSQNSMPSIVKKKWSRPLRRAAMDDEFKTLNRRVRAIYGFALLEGKAKAAEPELVALCASDDREERYWGFMALACIGPEKSILLPIATRLLNDPDSEIRHGAAETITETYPDEAEKAGVYAKFPELRSTEAVH